MATVDDAIVLMAGVAAVTMGVSSVASHSPVAGELLASPL
jgi:hypothetical protein